jgi:Fic family protein
MLFQTPELNKADLTVLAEIEQFRQKLRHQIAEPRRWLGQLRRSLVAGAIRGSNTIEGYTIDESDAQALVAGEEMLTTPDEETQAAVEGYRDALTYAQQAAHFEVFRYESMLLSTLHFMMTKHDLAKWPGRYRTGDIWVTGGLGNPPIYTGPDPKQVPELMNEFIESLNAELTIPVFVRSAIAHLNLVSIHPWRDGNGRMSRCLHTLILARDKVLAPEFSSIEEWLGMSTHNTGLYYNALRYFGSTYQPDKNTHSWVRFCLRAHHLQAQLVERRLQTTATLWNQIAELAQTRGLQERVVSALYAAGTGHARRHTYQTDENLTRDQAIRDLQTLKRQGLIEPAGQGRTQYYIAGQEIRQLVHDIQHSLTNQPLREPYPGEES